MLFFCRLGSRVFEWVGRKLHSCVKDKYFPSHLAVSETEKTSRTVPLFDGYLPQLQAMFKAGCNLKTINLYNFGDETVHLSFFESATHS